MLNFEKEVEMDASIMDGSNLQLGAVTVVKNIENPIRYKYNYQFIGHNIISDIILI